MGKIIASFTGTGKSELVRTHCPPGLTILDLDSGDFSFIGRSEEGKKDPEYPNNYVKAIIEEIGRSDVVLISCIGEVMDTLIDKGYEVTLVYPTSDQKQEYRNRFHNRPTTVAVAEMLTANFDTFLKRAQAQEGCQKIILKPGQYLSDVLPEILAR